jgi:NAD(P)-dependent dehydrogenase (short-subunit alcohol dehydrogenase family)
MLRSDASSDRSASIAAMGPGGTVSGFLQDKVVAVTGAGRGIGRAVALACAAEGARVVVADFGVSMDGSEPSSEVAEAVVAEITGTGGSAVAVAGDIATMDGGADVVSAALDTWGRLDGAICVAGILRERMLFNMSEDEFDDVVRVHLKGTFTVYRAAAAVMRKQEGGGALVGFTSGVWALGSVAQANYAAAKGGIVSLTYSAAVALERYGVRANVIAPVARTRMSANVPMDLAEMGDAEDVAPMAVYLVSDAASQVTGQVYSVVGDKIAVWSQPREVRAMWAGARWTPEGIAERLPAQVGTERLPMLDRVAEMRAAAAAGEKPNA